MQKFRKFHLNVLEEEQETASGQFPPPPYVPLQPIAQKPELPMASEQFSRPLSPPTLPSSAFTPFQSKRQPRRRSVPKMSPVNLIICLVFLVPFLALLAVLFFQFVLPSFSRASTPADTLNAYCHALKNHDYVTAYRQFSPHTGQFVNEGNYNGTFQYIDTFFGGLVDCKVGEVTMNDSASMATGTFTLIYHSGILSTYTAQLAREGDVWKMTKITS